MIEKVKENKLKMFAIFVGMVIFVIGIVAIINRTGDTYAISTSDYYCEDGSLNVVYFETTDDYYCCPSNTYYKGGIFGCVSDEEYSSYSEASSICDSLGYKTMSEANATTGKTVYWCYNEKNILAREKSYCYRCLDSSDGDYFYAWGTGSIYNNVSGCSLESSYDNQTDCLAKNSEEEEVVDVDIIANANGGYISYVEGVDDLASNLTKYMQTCFVSSTNLTCSIGGNVEATLSGKTFTGWGTSTDCKSGKAITEYEVSETTEFYACYIDNSSSDSDSTINYTVKYNANGGTGTTASSSHTYDVSSNLTANGFSKTGYTFVGWSTSANGSVVYGDKASVTNLSSTNGGVVTLYAVWKANTYTVSYNANGGTGTTASSSHTYDVSSNLTANGFSKTGYTFVGWSTSAIGSVVYGDKASVTNLSSTNGGVVTLYAVWKANTYNITYKNAIVTGFPSSGTYDEEVTINNPTKSVTVYFNDNKTDAIIDDKDVEVEFMFKGWISDDINTSTAYYATTAWTNKSTLVKDTTFKNLTPISGATVTLVANWDDSAITLPNVTKDGYICSWNTKSSGKGDSYRSGDKYIVGSESTSVNLYAICDKDSKTDDELSVGPTTGDTLIFVVWIIGIGSLGYSVYYFIKRKSYM